MKPKISSQASLAAEKKRLEAKAAQSKANIEQDWEVLKDEYLTPGKALNKAAVLMVPSNVRRSPVINAPINFIANKLLGKGNVVSILSDIGSGNIVRNVALGLIEAGVSFFAMRYAKRKIEGIGRKKE